METPARCLNGHQLYLQITAADSSPPPISAEQHLKLPLNNHYQLSVASSGPLMVHDTEDSLLLLFGYLYGEQPEAQLATLASELAQGHDHAPGKRHGLFALLFFDRNNETLRLYSDRVGNFRLFYQQQANSLRVSSDFCLLQTSDNALDPVWLNQSLHYRISPGFNSPDETIQTLSAGYQICFNRLDSAGVITPYWTMPERKPNTGSTLQQHCTQTEEKLLAALSDAGVSNKKTAILLSGGVDSALLMALGKRLNSQLLAITPEFIQGANPELETAKTFARQAEVEHLCVPIAAPQISESLQRVLSIIRQPPRSHSTLAIDQLFKRLSREYDAVIFGEAADTLFGSKLIRSTLQQIEQAKHPSPKARLLQLAARLCPLPQLSARSEFLEWELLQQIESAWQLDFLPNTRKQLPGKQQIAAQMDISGRLRTELSSQQELNQSQLAALIRHFLLTVDVFNHFYCIGSQARYWGLELISPFIDHRVYSLANQLSEQDYHSQQTAKPVLKALASQYFNPELIYQPKQGFPVPYHDWLNGPLQAQAQAASDFIRTQLSPQLATDKELLWTMVCLRALHSDQQIAEALTKLADR